jgi:RNA polymerase sigma factor (sigma-70 family)
LNPSTHHEQSSIEQIYQTHASMVYRIACLMLKNTADAEEALQTVFLKLLKFAGSFESGEHLKRWLITTTKNTCRDSLKSPWRKRRVGLTQVEEPASESPWNRYSPVGAAVMKLSPKYRVPLYLYYFEGYSTEEIAAMLDAKPSTIRWRLKTARDKLKLVVEEDKA